MLRDCELPPLVFFFFSFMRALDIKKKILYEICHFKFFGIQLVLDRVNATRVLSDLLKRVSSLLAFLPYLIYY